MLTPKENLLETLKKDGKPDRLVNGYEAFAMVLNDPCQQYTRGNRVRGTTSYDRWGTEILFPADAPAAIPHVTPENQIIQDICDWKRFVRVPDLEKNCRDGWEPALEKAAEIDRSRYFVTSFMGTGIFEQLHMLMTFEDTLMNFLLEPEAMQELIDCIFEYRLSYARLLIENLKPDAIISHDDWGAKTSLFMSPEIWRAFLKEPYRRLYGYMHENGVLVVHHADSFCEPIAEDMAEIGIDIWQGVLPENNIPEISRKLDGRMALMGGIASVIDREDASEEEIRGEVRRAVREYGSLKHFIPCMTYGMAGTVYPHVEPIIQDEIRLAGGELQYIGL